MKKSFKFLSLSIALISFVVLFSSFTPAPDLVPDPKDNNGVEVVHVKDRGWYLYSCSEPVLAESSTELFLDGTRVLIINKWKLPEGHCLIPTNGGAAIYPNLIVTPNGTAIGKAIEHPDNHK